MKQSQPPPSGRRCLSPVSTKSRRADATFYTWCKKYDDMEVSDSKRLKAVEEENAKLKKPLAEQMMDVPTFREMLTKNF